jgi:hypothetical protein
MMVMVVVMMMMMMMMIHMNANCFSAASIRSAENSDAFT